MFPPQVITFIITFVLRAVIDKWMQSGEDKRMERAMHLKMAEMEKTFKPEFINRLDEIVMFNHLGKEDLSKIINQLLSELKSRLRKKGITLRIDSNVIKFLIDEGYNSKYGARPLKRSIKNHLESKLADYIIDNNISGKYTVDVSENSGEVVLSSYTPKNAPAIALRR